MCMLEYPRGHLPQLMQWPPRRFLGNIPHATHSPGTGAPGLSTDRLDNGANRSFPGVRARGPRQRNSSSQGGSEREAKGAGGGAGEAALSSPRGSQRKTWRVEAVQLRTSTPLGLTNQPQW